MSTNGRLSPVPITHLFSFKAKRVPINSYQLSVHSLRSLSVVSNVHTTSI